MSFFGANTSLGATSTPTKTTGGLFGTPFGEAAATSQPAPAFGAQAAPTTAFGSQPATSAFGGGSGFGASAAAPAFGAQAAAPAFGAQTAAPAFGTATSTPGFGGSAFGSAPAFGAATTTAAGTGLGGGGFAGFGAAPATSQASLFGAPATSAAPPAFSGFGQPAAVSTAPASGFAGFGTTTTSAPAFGGFGTSQSTGFGGGAFGSSFAKPANSTVTPGFGGFGGTNFMLGQPQQQPAPISADEAFAQSILNVSIFGDDRDKIVAKWNYLQATWGTGKMFYSQSAAPVDITPENVMCRFKAIGYSRMPGKDNKLGLVALNFCRELSAVKPHQQQVVQTLHSLFGSKPNMLVHIDSIKELENKKCQMVIYVEEKLQHAPNESKRILATELSNYLNQASLKPQLNNLGIVEALAHVLPDEDQLKEYLENPPRGVDPRMWRQANSDNPDASKLIPVPMVGFSDLKWRVKCQEQETDTHALYMKKVEGELTELRQRHATATAKIIEHKRKLAELGHRILRIIVKQECTRKVGTSLTPEEEAMRTKLQNMQAVVSAPTQFKGRLSELLSQMRMQRNQFAANGGAEYAIDKEAEDEMKTFLTMQQRAMEVLSETVNKDMKALDVIIKGLPELRQS
ncbi:LOW QUALITY PROTEIN: probable nucleoporin Nup54 [Drosophila gunungcola]|uniref:LOW QUALITY PROTEIN: probable nucleoporin Nup54 n=1 Tax=Drosophila gunungcola TaxID=103775 RepID=UPI0022DEF4A7|nr:LOW QUALITY PROTEIN: probable nucleoporin Nup54 [Drosophila gunungcola]